MCNWVTGTIIELLIDDSIVLFTWRVLLKTQLTFSEALDSDLKTHVKFIKINIDNHRYKFILLKP